MLQSPASTEKKPGRIMRTLKLLVAYDLQVAVWNGLGSRMREGKASLRSLMAPRRLDAPDAPDMTDFQVVLRHWGIQEHERQQVMGGLAAELLLGFVPAFLLAAWLAQGSSYLLAFALGAFSAVGILTRSWRLQVLYKRRFTPFLHWLTFRR